MNNNSTTTQVKSTQQRNLILLIVAVTVGAMALMYIVSDHSTNQMSSKSERLNFVSPLQHVDAESIVLEKTQKALRDTKTQTDNLQQKVDALSSAKKSEDMTTQKSNDVLAARVAALEKQLADQSNPNSINPSFGSTSAMNGRSSYQGNFLTGAKNSSSQVDAMAGGIREDKLSLSPKPTIADTVPLKNPDTYVPAGAFVSATMLSGADASAAVNAQSNPEPLVFRLNADGTLPNHRHSHLKDCFLTAAVIGDISSERGIIRSERLSCTFPNGQIVEQEVEATVTGTDGKAGVRGTPLWRDGAITQRVFTAGFLSGAAQGMSNSYTTSSISPQGAVQTLEPGKMFQNGVANGSKTSMDKLSDYYIQRAEQYHPVIQISAGTSGVDVVFLKGFFLDGKKHEDKDQTVGNFASGETTSPNFFPSTPISSDSQTLPLSAENVRRIQEKSKELGLRVTPETNVS